MAACLLCHQPLVQDLPLRAWLQLQPLMLPAICPRCLATFSPIAPATACPGCGRADSPSLCADCQRWKAGGETLLHHRAVFNYDAGMQTYIQLYKGVGDYGLRLAFRDRLIPPVRRAAFVPLVSEPAHLAARGFDPVLGLFDHLKLSFWLTKSATERPQAKKNRAARLLTPQSFTAVVPANPPNTVCLLDDLYTTGRTFYHAAAALRDAGYRGTITSFSLVR